MLAGLVQKGEETEITREQEALKSSIHFSAINVTPDGATAVGFTDNSNGKQPMHYYLKVGEERDGWKVIEADPIKATMKIAKNDVEVSLTLGANSANGGGTTSARSAPSAGPQRPGLLGQRRGVSAGDGAGLNRMVSLRERRAAREAARVAEAEKKAAREAEEAEKKAEEAEKEKAERAAEREEQRKELLQQLKDELKAQRDAAEAERAAREAERAARESESDQQNQVEANAENED